MIKISTQTLKKLGALLTLAVVSVALADSPVLPISRGVTPNISAKTITLSASVQTPLILGSGGNTRISLPNAGTTTITSTQPTTGSAVGNVIDTNSTYTSGDKLFSVRNNGSEQFYIGFAGAVNSAAGSYQRIGAGSAQLLANQNDSGGAQTAIRLSNAQTLTNASSNIWCGYSDNGTTSQLCLRKDGALVPSNNNTTSVGTSSAIFKDGYFGDLLDPANNLRISGFATAGSNSTNYRGAINDGASAVAHKFGNINTLSTSGANIANFYNDNLSTLKLSIDKDGSVVPAISANSDLGALGSAFRDLYTTSIRDAAGTFRFSGIVSGNSNNYRGSVTSSGTSIAHKLGNVNALVTSGDQIAGFYNNDPTSSGVERSYVGYDGSYTGLVSAVGGIQITQISPPTGVAVSCTTTGGTLTAGTYAYRVSATSYGGAETTAAAEVTGSVTSGSTGSCSVSWSAVLGATGYKVYGRTVGSELLIPSGTISNPTTVTFLDTGSGTPSGGLPAQTTGVLQLSGSGVINDTGNTNRISLITNSASQYRGSQADVSGKFEHKFAPNTALGTITNANIAGFFNNNTNAGTDTSPQFAISAAGKLGTYNGVATAGMGVSPTYAYGSQSAITTSGTTVATYTPSAQGFFEIGGASQITAWTSGTSGGLQVAYTDCAGAAQTLRLNGESGTGPTANVQTLSATGSINFYTQSFCANAATITLQAINPGVATVSYYGFIRQVN